MTIKNTILLLENDRVFADKIKTILHNYGYAITHETAKTDSISVLEKTKYDLILLSVVVGEELKAAETARFIYDTYRVPVLFVTSMAGKSIIEKTSQNGVMGFVLKPLVPKDIILALELIIYRHTMEIKLRDSEKKYTELFNSTFQVIVECNLDGKITNINKQGLTMFGLTETDLRKDVFLKDFIKDNSSGSIIEVCKRSSFIAAGNLNTEFQLINKFRQKYEIEELLSPVYEHNKLSGYRGILLDITNRKLKQSLASVFSNLCQFYDRSDIDLLDVSDYIIRKLKDIFTDADLIYFDNFSQATLNPPANAFEKGLSSHFENYTKLVRESGKPLFMDAHEIELVISREKVKYPNALNTEWMGIPLVSKEKCYGVFVFASYSNPHAFSQDDFEKLIDFFDNVTLFMDKLHQLKELKRSENLFKTLVNTINEGIVTVDLNSTITFASNRLHELSGYTHEEVIGRKGNMFLRPNDLKMLFDIIESRKKGISDRYELKVRVKSGEFKNFHVNGAPYRDENGTVIGSIGTFTDITDKKRQEADLLATEGILQEITHKMEVAMWVYSFETKEIQYLSPAFKSLFEVELQEIYKTNSLFKFIHPLDKRAIMRHNMKHYAKGSCETTYRIITPSGKVKWIQDRSVLVKDAEGKVIKIVGYAQEITKIKFAEEKYLKKLEEKKSIIKALPASFVILNKGDEIINTFFKDTELDFLPVKEKRMHGNKISRVFDEKISAVIQSKALQCESSKQTLVFELEVDRDSIKHTFEISMSPMEEGKVLMIVRKILSLKNSFLSSLRMKNFLMGAEDKLLNNSN